MSTCTTCYGTNTSQPCASVGCLSTNYGKCITYSGSNLFCQAGSIATFTFAGTAVSPTTDTTVVASVTGGNGTDATFSVLRRAGQTTYEVTLVNQGSNYEVSDVLTIAGTSVGGASPLNDIVITVTTLAAVIANGDNLDTVISNINNRLCLVASTSPSGLDYTAFNYQCLRMGGNLEGVGTVITTAQGFTEAVASALCSLNTRLKGVELPPIIVDTYFGGSIVSGTSTLTQILNEYGEAIGDVNDKFTVTTSSSVCGTFTNLTTLTTRPSSSASLGTWFDWVSGNICTNFTAVDTHITSELAEHTLVNTFLYGVVQAFPNSGARGTNSVDTACLPGGSATSNLRSAVNLIATELCSLKSIVTAGPTSNYTVAWSGCFTSPYTANSVFNAQGLGSFTNTTTLQTHLNQIATALSALNIKFSSDFTVTNSSCGPVISLVGGSTFTCASLASCNLNAMADVTYIQTLLPANTLVRNSSGVWTNMSLQYVIDGRHNFISQFATINASNNLELRFNLPYTRTTRLIPAPSSSGFLVAFGPTPHISDFPKLILDEILGTVTTHGSSGVRLINNSGGNLTIANDATVNLLNVVDLSYLIRGFPQNGEDSYFPVSVVEKTSGGTLSAVHNCLVRVYSEANSIIIPASATMIGLVNVKGQSIIVANGNYLDIYFGGISWSTI
jgi:hypothetical protein